MGSIVRVGAQAFFPESFRQNSMNLPAGDGRHQRPDGTAAAGGNGPDWIGRKNLPPVDAIRKSSFKKYNKIEKVADSGLRFGWVGREINELNVLD